MGPPYGRLVSVFAKWSGPPAPGRPWPEIPAPWRAWRWLAPRRDVLVAPLCGAIVLAALALPGERFQVALLGFCALAGGAVLARRVAAQAALLPLMRHFYRFIGPFLGLGALALVELLADTPAAGPLDMLAALGVTGLVAEPWAGLFGDAVPGRGARGVHRLAGRRRAAFAGARGRGLAAIRARRLRDLPGRRPGGWRPAARGAGRARPDRRRARHRPARDRVRGAAAGGLHRGHRDVPGAAGAARRAVVAVRGGVRARADRRDQRLVVPVPGRSAHARLDCRSSASSTSCGALHRRSCSDRCRCCRCSSC